MTLKRLFTLAALTGVVALLGVGAGIFATMKQAVDKVDALAEVAEIEALALQIAPLAMEANIYHSGRALKQIADALDDIAAAEDRLRDTPDLPVAAVNAMQASAARLSRAVSELQAVYAVDPGPAMQLGLRQTIAEQAEELIFAATTLNDIVDRLQIGTLDSAREALVRASVLALIGGGVAWFALGWMAVSLNARIFAPLHEARATLAEIGGGALGARVDVRRRDEIGDLGESINAMAGDLADVTASKEELEAEIALRRAVEHTLRDRNARLSEINHELDRFAYIASHDLRAPLRGVRSLAGWIVEDLGGDVPAETRRHVELMQNRLDRLDAMLDSLLQFNRIGRTRYKAEPVDVCDMIRDIGDLYLTGAPFALEVECDALRITTHRAPLEMILRNLIGNAIKHHDRGEGRIVVRATEEDDRLRFTVEDDGPGIPEALQERVFRMFETLQPRDAVEGSGMGLAMIRKTARLYGSDVEVRSPARDGRGCAFAFTWPKTMREGDFLRDGAGPTIDA
jgi:signal transduction histidine kinase